MLKNIRKDVNELVLKATYKADETVVSGYYRKRK